MLYGVRRDLQSRLRQSGYQHAGLYPLRNPMVSLSHAAVGGATGQYRLHSGEPGSRVGAGTVSEFTLGGYMQKHERAAAFGGSDGQAYSVAIYVDEEPDVRGSAMARRCSSCAGPRRGPAARAMWRPRPSPGARPRRRPSPGCEALSLYDVKAALDEAIARAPGAW